MKYRGSKISQNNAGMYITCNSLPTFGKETENVEKRLAVFHTKAIQNPVSDAPQWIEDNAMDCLVWIINTINRSKNLLYKEERFYEREHDDFIVTKENQESIELNKVATVCIADINIDPAFPVPQENVPGPSALPQQYEETIPRWLTRLKTKGVYVFICVCIFACMCLGVCMDVSNVCTNKSGK